MYTRFPVQHHRCCFGKPLGFQSKRWHACPVCLPPTACHSLPQPAAACHSLLLPAAACHCLPLPATACHSLPQLATACRSFATAWHNLEPICKVTPACMLQAGPYAFWNCGTKGHKRAGFVRNYGMAGCGHAQ